MSQLLARILLSVFLIPLAGIVYLTVFFTMYRITRSNQWYRYDDLLMFMGAGLLTWIFMAVYWIALWRSFVRWTGDRILWTAACAGAAAVVGLVVGLVTGRSIDDEVGLFMASITAPILWLAGTVVIWRETKQERAERLRNANSDAVVCPTCGYNLTGLTESRCPECGSKFTLNDLLAAQPARKMAEIEQG